MDMDQLRTILWLRWRLSRNQWSRAGGLAATLTLIVVAIALAISATTNPAAELALGKLEELRNCEVHMTHIPTPGDEAGLRRMGANLTSDPNFSTNDLFMT